MYQLKFTGFYVILSVPVLLDQLDWFLKITRILVIIISDGRQLAKKNVKFYFCGYILLGRSIRD